MRTYSGFVTGALVIAKAVLPIEIPWRAAITRED